MSTKQPTLASSAPAEVRKAWAKLSPQQRMLATALGRGESQIRACIEAGYNEKYIKKNASKTANHPAIQAVAAWFSGQAMQEHGASVQRIIKELSHVALSNPQNLVRIDPNRPELGARFPGLDQLDESMARAISSFEIDAKGKLKITFWDKIGAADKLLKMHNAYPEKKQDGPKETIVGVVVLPAKRPYQGHQQEAIEGEARHIERTELPPPPTKKFRVLKDTG